MRWKKKMKPKYVEGHKRTVTRFLWIPKTIGHETRWLETASWVEKFVDATYISDGTAYWSEVRWISE